MRRLLAGAIVSAFVLTGCANPESRIAPECGHNSDTLIIEAQSVPTATLLPCVRSLPLGWMVNSLEVRDGLTRMFLDSDRAGIRSVEVALSRTCDTSGTTERRSDEPGTRLYEKVAPLSNDHYSGARFYVFRGGCVTYRFDLRIDRGAVLANEVALGLGFFSRAAVAADLHKIHFDL